MRLRLVNNNHKRLYDTLTILSNPRCLQILEFLSYNYKVSAREIRDELIANGYPASDVRTIDKLLHKLAELGIVEKVKAEPNNQHIHYQYLLKSSQMLIDFQTMSYKV